jgi:hypothetical protein
MGMARPRTGNLYLAKTGWRARLTTYVNGTLVKKVVKLDTHDRKLAEAKLLELVAMHPQNLPAKQIPDCAAEARRAVCAAMIDADNNVFCLSDIAQSVSKKLGCVVTLPTVLSAFATMCEGFDCDVYVVVRGNRAEL